MNGPEEKNRVQGEERTEFEQALARAMRPVELRAETAAKFLALADEAEQKRVHAGGGLRRIRLSNGGRLFAMPWPRSFLHSSNSWLGGAIAAVLAVGCFVGAHIHTEHERRLHAERQFEAAERITDQALARAREQLEQRGIHLD
jgi:hypothetical protein